MSAVAPLRVLIAEDSFLIREGIAQLLQTRPEVEVVAACSDLHELLDAVGKTPVDVVVTDIRMPPRHDDEGIRAAAALRETHPDVGVVVLSQYAVPDYALALLEGGAARRAYLLKERVADLDQLVGAIEAVARGASVIDPKVVDKMLGTESSQLADLTRREREILSEMAQGKSNAAIASSLFLTERAVEKHSNAIFGKLGLTYEKDVNKRVKAVLVYLAESS
jgi:DNA-binding NarL/FixJ family response regulator